MNIDFCLAERPQGDIGLPHNARYPVNLHGYLEQVAAVFTTAKAHVAEKHDCLIIEQDWVIRP